MKITKIAATALVATALVAGVNAPSVTAQEADDFAYDDASTEDSYSAFDDTGAEESFGFGFDSFDGADSGSGVTLSGSASTDFRGYVDPRQNNISLPADMTVDGSVSATLGVNYEGSMADADIQLKFDLPTGCN